MFDWNSVYVVDRSGIIYCGNYGWARARMVLNRYRKATNWEKALYDNGVNRTTREPQVYISGRFKCQVCGKGVKRCKCEE